jgi:putative membrane protein
MTKTVPLEDPRIYLAAERTLLAWVRTGLAMMGFGFVVARFGLFLRELAATRDLATVPPAAGPQHVGLSLWIGTTLVVLGVVVTLAASVGYWRTILRLNRGETLQFRPLSLALVTAVLLSLIGLGMAIYLAVGLRPTGV